MDVPFPQIMKEIFDQFKIEPQEQLSERICEQIVEVSVPQVDVLEALQFPIVRLPTRFEKSVPT